MKKRMSTIVTMLAVAAICLTGCGNNNAQTAEPADTSAEETAGRGDRRCDD